MWGTIDGEPFFFMVAHWPSHLGGKDATEFKRIAVGEQMRRIADSVLKVNPATKIVAMGDFNDDPTDPSMLEGLNAKPKVKDLQPGDFFSPFHAVLRAGMGTLAYGDAWNLFDNIVVSENLVNAKPGELRLVRAPGSKYYGNVFKRNYMIQREGQFKGYPLRTYVGNNFQGGYSDHFPFISTSVNKYLNLKGYENKSLLIFVFTLMSLGPRSLRAAVSRVRSFPARDVAVTG